MRKPALRLAIFTIFTLLAHSVSAQKMSYDVSISPDEMSINVKLTYINETGNNTPIHLKMPAWAPGYYKIMDFAKYLFDFKANAHYCSKASLEGQKNANVNALTWEKRGKNEWVIDAGGADTVEISYRIFANERSVCNCRVEETMAFIPGNGVYLYEDGKKDVPVSVTFHRPDGWENISTGLKKTAETGNTTTYEASDFDVLYDSPVLMGNYYATSYNYNGHQYDFAFETPDGLNECPFLEDFKKIVDSSTDLMQNIPYDNYCLIHLGRGGGGLEHLNSQACYTGGTFRFANREEYVEYLDFVAHEYYHLYNVKHIRPIELGPFDYDNEVFTPLLWISEGFTCYYSSMILRRAGLISGDEQLGLYSNYIRETETTEGHKHMSLRESSLEIWLTFFNFLDTTGHSQKYTISYYEKGPVVATLFDCEIRDATKNKCSLDDLMRLLYYRYDQQQHRGFTESEFWSSVEEIIANGANEEVAKASTALLRSYVDTTADLDYDTILAKAGLKLNRDEWKLERTEKPNKLQKTIRSAIIGE